MTSSKEVGRGDAADIRSILQNSQQRLQFWRPDERITTRTTTSSSGGSDASDVCGNDWSVTACPETGAMIYRVVVSLEAAYSAEEVSVHLDQTGGTLVVEAEHVEVQPGSRVQRHLKRCFQVPAGTDLGRMECKFSEVDRRLELEAPFLGHPVNRCVLPQ